MRSLELQLLQVFPSHCCRPALPIGHSPCNSSWESTARFSWASKEPRTRVGSKSDLGFIPEVKRQERKQSRSGGLFLFTLGVEPRGGD